MPHDKFGKVVEPGDEVIVRFKVLQVFGEDENTTCNVNLQSIELMEGKNTTNLSCINTKMTEKM